MLLNISVVFQTTHCCVEIEDVSELRQKSQAFHSECKQHLTVRADLASSSQRRQLGFGFFGSGKRASEWRHSDVSFWATLLGGDERKTTGTRL